MVYTHSPDGDITPLSIDVYSTASATFRTILPSACFIVHSTVILMHCEIFLDFLQFSR